MVLASEEEVENLERHYWKGKGHDIARDWRLYIMLLPIMIFLLLWKYFPIGSMIVSFKQYTNDSSFGGGVYSSLFVGFDCFKVLFNSSNFWGAFRNTFVLSFYGLVFGFPFPNHLCIR